MSRNSEPSINTVLGQVLQGKHPRWEVVAEASAVLQNRARRPDMLVDQEGASPVIVETEFPPGASVEEDAARRLGMPHGRDGRAVEKVVAVLLDERLRRGQSDLAERVAEADYRYAVLGGLPESPTRWPASGWLRGGADDLAIVIEHAGQSERIAAEGTVILERTVRQTANLATDMVQNPATLAKLAGALCQEPGIQTTRMAMAILFNAVAFHRSIAEHEGVPPLSPSRDATPGPSFPREHEIISCWHTILRDVNYWPIFELAWRLFVLLPGRIGIRVVDRMEQAVQEIEALGAVGMKDISGQMFQRLIADRKFLATFYTLPSSSALLATVGVDRLEVDWSDPDGVTGLRIADLACGTGMLLGAAYQAVRSRHRLAGGDDEKIHGAMMENALIGADIMPAATHLTASMLSSAHPGIAFAGTKIMTCPYGEQPEDTGRSLSLGSLDLIEGETGVSVLGVRPAQVAQTDVFGSGREEIHGKGFGERDDGTRIALPHGAGDLLIMNPPFTRPTNHEIAEVPVPSFAGFATAEDEQRAMSGRLKEIRRKLELPAGHGNAGLASNFIDLAHAKTRPGGVLALVLPAAFAQGSSWSGARDLIERCYEDVLVVSVAASGSTDRAFTADTGMAEVLVVATRRRTPDHDGNRPGGDGTEPDDALFVNLRRRPATPGEGVVVGEEIQRLPGDRRAGWMKLGDDVAGCYVRAPLAKGGCAGLRDPQVAEVMLAFTDGKLRLPRVRELPAPPVARLGALGRKGRLHRDINGRHPDGSARGPFDIVKSGPAPEFPVLWRHDAERERTLRVVREAEGMIRDGMREEAFDLWEQDTSKLHFNQDFQINSQSLAACLTDEPTIGGRAWPNFIAEDPAWEVPLALWANTTLGLMSFWWLGTRQHQGRAVLTLSRLPELPVLDPRALSADQLERAEKVCARLRDVPLLPASEAYRDAARAELDREVLVEVFGLPESVLGGLEVLRGKWCEEPTVHGGKGTRPRHPRAVGAPVRTSRSRAASRP